MDWQQLLNVWDEATIHPYLDSLFLLDLGKLSRVSLGQYLDGNFPRITRS